MNKRQTKKFINKLGYKKYRIIIHVDDGIEKNIIEVSFIHNGKYGLLRKYITSPVNNPATEVFSSLVVGHTKNSNILNSYDNNELLEEVIYNADIALKNM